jgi:hypothetical protein
MSEQHSTNGRPEPIVAYYRMSDDKQENSIERQRSQVEPYATRHGYVIVRKYVDEGELPAPEEYVPRFPDDLPTIRAIQTARQPREGGVALFLVGILIDLTGQLAPRAVARQETGD